MRPLYHESSKKSITSLIKEKSRNALQVTSSKKEPENNNEKHTEYSN